MINNSTLQFARIGFGLMTIALAAAAPGDASLKTHPDSTTWHPLFRTDLSDAIFPKGIWHLENGALTASEDQAIWTKDDYENFMLDLEFKCGDAANSGVVVYATNITGSNWIPNSVEIQILDDYAEKWSKVPKNWLCGGIFGHVAPRKQVVRKAGEWNRMSISCRGPRIEVVLNGEQVCAMDMKQFTSAKTNPDGSEVPAWLPRPPAELATKGRIGLQGKHGGAPIYFRNVKVKRL